MANLKVNLNGLILQNPVMTASGTFGYGGEFNDFMDLNNLGAIVVKGISLKPNNGNPPPRIVETAAGMLNAIGLENIGIDAFVKERMHLLRTLTNVKTIVNIYGTEVKHYSELAQKFDAVEGVHALEINISCPNVKCGGIAFGTDPKAAAEVVTAVRKGTKKFVIAKLSPNVTDITPIAKACEDAGAEAISLINTITGMAINVNTRKPKLANITGGLSGPAIKPVALRFVWQAARAVKVPIIGIGGIMTGEDAVEFLLAGASAVQIGMASFVTPNAASNVLCGIIDYMQKYGVNDVNELIGAMLV